MPQPISRRRVAEFRGAFAGEMDSLAALYRNAAADMLDILADAAALSGQRARAAALLHQYQVVLADLNEEAAAWIELNIPRAYGAGLQFVDGCAADYRRAGINLRDVAGRVSGQTESAVFAQVHREAVRAITDAMLDAMSKAAAQIGRRVDDVFRREGILAVTQGIVEGRTRAEVSRTLEQRLLQMGRPDFVDKLGRHWPLDRYAEMVARTTTREAMTQGTIQRLREHGVELAQVSHHACADFCTFYEEAIVSIGDEPHPVYPPISAIDGGPPFHPRCCAEGTTVLSARGPLPIESVVPGDMVLTHKGRYREVTAASFRAYTGPVVTIGKLRVTPEHPVLTRRGWIPAGGLASGDSVAVLLDRRHDGRGNVFGAATAAVDTHHGKAHGPQIAIPHGIARSPRATPVPPTTVDLQNQMEKGQVEVHHVRADHMLRAKDDAGLGQRLRDGQFHLRRRPTQRFCSGRCVPLLASDRPHRVAARQELVAASAVGLEGRMVGIAGTVTSLLAWLPGSDTEAWKPDAAECGVVGGAAADLLRDLRHGGTLLVAAPQVLAERLVQSLGEPRLCLASPVLMEALRGACRRAAELPYRVRIRRGRSATDGTCCLHAASLALPCTTTNGYRGRVYNLSVAEDESYVADGVVVHNCVHVLTPFVERLATEEEKKAGMIPPDVLNRSPAELQRRYREEHPRAAVDGRAKTD